ncbi:MAG: hypothetical protein E7017_04070 [Alphaproteobacteria bacterium]|nr:hypothetical protein [Alphaproteobacteria bacterium]
MDLDLLQNMYDAAPELWYGIGVITVLLILAVLVLSFWLLKVKQKAYFLRRDRERYAETLYASHDGYFAFIYPDDKVNDPRKAIVERCSRRLAVILGLEKGIKSDFNEILKNFYKDDVKKISKYVGLLKEEGVAFEDYFLLKTSNKYIRLEGVRINGADGNIYCDMIWFRDVSFATNRIKSLEKEKNSIEEKFLLQQDLLDNLPFAVWLRDDNLDIAYCNKKFVEFIPGKTRDEVISSHIEITGTGGESISRSLAVKTHNSKRPAKTTTGVVVKGTRLAMEAHEVPFYAEQKLDKTYSAGCLININELDELKRNLKQYQDAQLEILGMLGTAFAVFNQNMVLQFNNLAFEKLWKLEKDWLNSQATYGAFLDVLREKRLLPEVPDYKAFRNDELKKFNQIIEPVSDLLHLPNGKTLRRMRAPYPMGGTVFAYEDISDRLAATSAYNALISVQNEILTTMFDGILIFGANGRLSFFNDAYITLWNASKEFLQSDPTFDEVLDSQRSFFAKNENWESLKQGISANILSMTSKKMTLQRTHGGNLQLGVANLSDGALLIVYRNID